MPFFFYYSTVIIKEKRFPFNWERKKEIMFNGFKKVSYFNSEDPIAVFVQECNLIVKGIISDKAMLDELKEEFLLYSLETKGNFIILFLIKIFA